jgi:hypothetical protein
VLVVAVFASSYDAMKLWAMCRSVEVRGTHCLGEAEPKYRLVSLAGETACVAEKKAAAFARRWGMQRWPHSVRRLYRMPWR